MKTTIVINTVVDEARYRALKNCKSSKKELKHLLG